MKKLISQKLNCDCDAVINKELDRIIDIDQSPIGRTPRSNPATYTGLYNIRDILHKLMKPKYEVIIKDASVLMSRWTL